MDMDGYGWKWIDMNQNLLVPFVVGMIIHGCLCWIYLAGHRGTKVLTHSNVCLHSSMAISGTNLLEAPTIYKVYCLFFRAEFHGICPPSSMALYAAVPPF